MSHTLLGAEDAILATPVTTGAELRKNQPQVKRVDWIEWSAPGMGINLWGDSPLYPNPVNVF